MTMADQAALAGQNERVGKKQGRPKRRTFTAAYKARILAEFDSLPEGGPEPMPRSLTFMLPDLWFRGGGGGRWRGRCGGSRRARRVS